ncbi:IMPACT family protein [Microbacterium sp. ZW T5_56]|uniref:IMPACT family protein n=1 Tax=Microbacterium sp. ZW T5_56 TaxID=3378081 RepID=UPI0038554F1F
MRSYPDSIAATVEHELVIKKSRFITHAIPVRSVPEADAAIAHIRTRYWDARHNCTAMITGVLGDQARSSDDGEPSGTAGMPMLEVLRRRELTDLVVIVTRYFGGIKLGAGGLVRAYSSAVSEALDLAAIIHRRELVAVTVEVPYADAGRYENVLRDWSGRHDAVMDETRYAASAVLGMRVSPDALDRFDADLAAASGGLVAAHRGEVSIIDVPVG